LRRSSLQPVGTLPLLSFFTGAGFLDLGFEQAGFPVIWHNEIDPWFVAGFQSGMSSVAGRKVSIENSNSLIDIGPNEIYRSAFQSIFRRSGPGPFGIIGGPPCPDFSVGGRNAGEQGSRGQLTRVYVERILELQPTFFVLENVKGLISTAVHREFLDRLIFQLERSYVVDRNVLNALDLGAPQDRERVIVLGFHRTWIKKHRRYLAQSSGERGWFPWPSDSRYSNAKKRFPWPSVSAYGESPSMPEVPYELTVASCLADDVKADGQSGQNHEFFIPYSTKFAHICEGDTSRKSFKRLHRWRYSPTVAYGNNEVHLHPFLPRRLSVREALRLQTVPAAYVLPPDMPLSRKFKTIGNGVPVCLARALAHSINKFLES